MSISNYRKLCTEFYDLDKPNAPAAALEFYLRQAKAANGPVLEPMCGTGRFLVPMREAGIDVDGTDGSPDMLQVCHRRLAEKGLSATICEQTLEGLAMPRQYSLIFIPVASFCLVTDLQQARQALARMYEALLPGGRLVIEIERDLGKESCSWPWGGRWITRPDGAKIICNWLGHYDAEQRVSYSLGRYELVKDAQLVATEIEDFNIRYYGDEEIRGMLREAGFTDICFYKLYADEPVAQGDAAMVAECRKP
jgi:SAM-dependent methyltransferase